MSRVAFALILDLSHRKCDQNKGNRFLAAPGMFTGVTVRSSSQGGLSVAVRIMRCLTVRTVGFPAVRTVGCPAVRTVGCP